MGQYYGIHADGDTLIDSGRIGGAGAGQVLITQLIAGWAAAPALNQDGKRCRDKFRRFLKYWGPKYRGELSWLRSQRDLEKALMDDTDDSAWVLGEHFDRMSFEPRICDEARSLLALWYAVTEFNDFGLRILISEAMLSAVRRAVTKLEELVSPWAPQCRRFLTSLQRSNAETAWVSIA